jgi:hypothetical protein
MSFHPKAMGNESVLVEVNKVNKKCMKWEVKIKMIKREIYELLVMRQERITRIEMNRGSAKLI